MVLRTTAVVSPLERAGVTTVGVRYRRSLPWELPADLPPLLRHANWRRQLEYLAGRFAAAEALQQCGEPAASLGIGADRAPIWPPGLTGSISHSRSLAFAAVGSRTDWHGIGIDVEQVQSAASVEDIVSSVATEVEMALLNRHLDRGHAATLVFSAKEAIYKAVRPPPAARIGFREAGLQAIEDNRLVFAASDRLLRHLPHTGELEVIFATMDAHVLTLCALRA